MAIDLENCEAYFQGEVRPIIFKVYTESGLPFTLTPDPNHDGKSAFCDLKNKEGNHLEYLNATLISDEPAEKKFVVSWDTGRFSAPNYYRLQVWVCCNISGHMNEDNQLLIEALIASEEITRYVKN